MDFIIVVGIGAILIATGVISPKPKDDEVAETEVVKTEEVVTFSCDKIVKAMLVIINKVANTAVALVKKFPALLDDM